MKRKIEIDRDCWDSGFGPLSQEQMEEYGLREYGPQPVDDTVLGRYVGEDGHIYEVLSTPDGYYLAKTHYAPHDGLNETYLCPNCNVEIDPTYDPEIVARTMGVERDIYDERVEAGLCPVCGRDAPFMSARWLTPHALDRPITHQTVEFECPRCHHRWIPRVEKPQQCPRCQRYFTY